MEVKVYKEAFSMEQARKQQEKHKLCLCESRAETRWDEIEENCVSTSFLCKLIGLLSTSTTPSSFQMVYDENVESL